MGGQCNDASVSGKAGGVQRGGRRGARRPTPQTRRPVTSQPHPGTSPQSDASAAERAWAETRSGARSARGYHYQDDVATWLCAQILAGSIDADVLVPEGHEDVTCEGASGWQVQIKSRQDHLRDFTAAEAAQHVLKVAENDEKRHQQGLDGRPALILEKGIDGFSPGVWGQVLADFPPENPLLSAVERLAATRGLQQATVSALARRVSVYVLPWQAARDQVAELMAQRYRLPPGVAGPVLLALRDAVGRCIHTNAESNFAARAGMDRTQIERVANTAATTIDRTGIEQALADGVCEPVDFDTPLPEDRFYEGVAAQPGHVAAGLAVPRPDLTQQIAAAVDHKTPVLITGPSGAGKSVLLWIAAASMRDILWFRVRRLRETDVAPLIALAHAYAPTERARIGFLVDGVGLGGNDAWDLLVRELAPVGGTALLGTARVEDLQPLRSLPDCVLIEPQLDEKTAEQIYSALASSGATSAAHWRAAYREAKGLTLEYTHRLTSGRRLADVLGEQVRRRIDDPGRGVEVGIIGLVAPAQRWGIDLDLRDVQRSLDASDPVFRQALGRLKDEHLVHELDGRLTGLHQLRSTALSDEVWRNPPPTVRSSAETLIGLVDDAQLTTLLMSILTEQPLLDDFVMSQLKAELRRRTSLSAWTSALHALRTVDFRRRCDRIVAEMDRLGVKPVDRNVTVQLAMLDADPLPMFKPEIQKAIPRIAPYLKADSPLRDAMAAAGVDVLASALCEGALDEARRLLAVLQGTSVALHHAVVAQLQDSPLEVELRDARCDELGDTLAAAQLVSKPLAACLFEAAGGEASVVRRLAQEYPQLVEADAGERDGAAVARARWLHVPGEYADDADSAVRTFAQVLLRCFPACDSVDVEARLPGDFPIQFGDHVAAVSHLQRRYDRPPTEVAWNRLRMNVAAASGGIVDATTRVAEARKIAVDTHRYLSDLVRLWCAGELRPQDRERLVRVGHDLATSSGELRTPVSVSLATLDSVEAVGTTPRNDPVHGLAWALVGNLSARLFDQTPNWTALASFVGDQLREYIPQIRREQWELLGQDPPSELDAMDATLSSLNVVLLEVAAGSMSRRAIRAIATVGPTDTSIYRVAEAARQESAKAEDEWVTQVVTLAANDGLVVEPHRRLRPAESSLARFPSQFAFGIEMDGLTQWDSAVESLRNVIDVTESTTHSAADRAGARVLVFPVVGGRPIRMLARAIVINVFPDTELFDSWADSLPEPWSTPLADAVVQAHRALETLSALGVLDARRGTAGVDQSNVDHQVVRFQEAFHTIERLNAQDSVVTGVRDVLVQLADRVQREFDDKLPEESTLAASLASGVTHQPNDDITTLGALVIVALTWDIDPEAANMLLDASEQTEAAADSTQDSSMSR